MKWFDSLKKGAIRRVVWKILVQDIIILEEPDEVACTLRDLQPLSFYGENKTLHLVTGLSL